MAACAVTGVVAEAQMSRLAARAIDAMAPTVTTSVGVVRPRSLAGVPCIPPEWPMVQSTDRNDAHEVRVGGTSAGGVLARGERYR